jgi:hypothetical protein
MNTAVSSLEAEIYAINESIEFLWELVQLFDFLEVKDINALNEYI